MVPVFYLIGSVLVRATAKKVMQELAKRGAKRIAASQAAKMKESPINVTMKNLDKVVKNLSRAPKGGPKRFEGTLNKGKPPTIRKPMQLKPKPRKDNAPKKPSNASTAPTVFKNAPKGGTRRRPGDDAKDITPKTKELKAPKADTKPSIKFNPRALIAPGTGAVLLGSPPSRGRDLPESNIKADKKSKASIKADNKITPKKVVVSKDSQPAITKLSALKVPEKVVNEVEIKTKADKSSDKKKEAPKKDANKKKELSSFGKAFKTARAKGKGTIFTHNNKKYVAITQDDLKKMKMTFNEYLKKKKKK